jgi:hypothetical protein
VIRDGQVPFNDFGEGINGLGAMRITVAPESYILPSLGVGVYGTPVVDTSLLDNIAFTVNMSTATNKTDAASSSMAAFIGAKNTADTVHAKIQGLLVSTVLGGDVFDAYGVQGHLTVDHDLATHDANAHITGLSGKVALHQSVEQGWVTGVLAIIEGDPDVAEGVETVTGLCHVMAAQIEATVKDNEVDSILYLGADAAVPAGIEFADSAHIAAAFKFAAASGCIDAHAVGAASNKQILIDIGGSPYAINIYAVGTE